MRKQTQDLGDPPLSDFRSMNVRVTDVDDLDPVFEPSSYSASLLENSTIVNKRCGTFSCLYYKSLIPQGDFVVSVSARDGDTGVDAEIFYTLEDDGNSMIDGELSFTIDPVTGEISVNVSSLDREIHPSYTLTVQVTFQIDLDCSFNNHSFQHTHRQHRLTILPNKRQQQWQ